MRRTPLAAGLALASCMSLTPRADGGDYHRSATSELYCSDCHSIHYSQSGAAALSGTLCDGSLPQIMQFIHAGGMTGKLSVHGEHVNGAVLFLNGHLYAATAGEAHGAEAVYACALERVGRFSFDRLERAQVQQTEKTIAGNTIHVIFECCRRLDEGERRL